MSLSCECHKIDWLSPLKNGGIGEYRYKPEFGGGFHTQCVGPIAMPCQDKVNLGQMTNEGLESVCKYIPGEEGSLFPKETFNWLRSVYEPFSAVEPNLCESGRPHWNRTVPKP
jgi:hypothetical protein